MEPTGTQSGKKCDLQTNLFVSISENLQKCIKYCLQNGFPYLKAISSHISKSY